MPLDPFGDFLAAVAHLAERDAGRRRPRRPRVPRRVLQAAPDRGAVAAGSTSCSATSPTPSRDAQGALVFTETVRAANHAINRLDPLRVDRPDHRLDRPTPAARDPRRPPRPEARRRRRAPRARRGHRRARREPRHRHEREPHPAPDDPADGPHPAAQAARGRRPLRDHVRQGHARGPGQPHRARRLPRRDRAHLRGDRRVRRRRSSRPSTRSSPPPVRRSSASRSGRRPSSDFDAARAPARGRRRPTSRSSSPTCRRSRSRWSSPSSSPPAGPARDRPRGRRVADQLHRVRRVVTARPVPVAGPRAERGLPLRT